MIIILNFTDIHLIIRHIIATIEIIHLSFGHLTGNLHNHKTPFWLQNYLYLSFDNNLNDWLQQRARAATEYLRCLTCDTRLAVVENPPSGAKPSSGQATLQSSFLMLGCPSSVNPQVSFDFFSRRWCCKNWIYPRSLTWYNKVRRQWCSPKFHLSIVLTSYSITFRLRALVWWTS